MIITTFALVLLAQSPPRADVEPEHRKNSIYTAVLQDGWTAAGATVRFPRPLLQDGMQDVAQREALLRRAGSDRALADLLRDSVTAPFILEVHDQKGAAATIRVVDLWFAVRADLKEFDPLDVARQTSGKASEAGNMRFESRLLGDEELKRLGRSTETGESLSRWFAQVKGRLLDRIAVQATDEAAATRTEESLVIASRSDPAFDQVPELANQWRRIGRDAGSEPATPYAGGMSYAKVSRLRHPEGTLLVEFHGAFSEPDGWFQGAPILRSKFAPIAQDQIRRLRRELLKARSNSNQTTTSP